jgi:3-methylfumaryl-CoA hydratase
MMYNAALWNGHRIHFDEPYAREVEGYPGLVVHGPLTAVMLAWLTLEKSGKRITRFTFQGRAPLFDLHPFRLVGRAEGDAAVALEARGPDGKIAMQATAELD